MNPRQTLSAIDLFAGLPPGELDALAQRAILREYEPGEDLFQEGEPCRGIHILSSGAARIMKNTPSGRQIMLALQEAPATVAEVPVFDGGPYPATVTAIQNCTAFTILKEDFLSSCRRNPDLGLKFLQVFGMRLRHLVALVERITFGSVRQRLAVALLEYSTVAASDRFPLPETQEQLAARLGTVREVVSRNLSRFQTEGLIRVRRREIEILSAAGLQAEAETEL